MTKLKIHACLLFVSSVFCVTLLAQDTVTLRNYMLKDILVVKVDGSGSIVTKKYVFVKGKADTLFLFQKTNLPNAQAKKEKSKKESFNSNQDERFIKNCFYDFLFSKDTFGLLSNPNYDRQKIDFIYKSNGQIKLQSTSLNKLVLLDYKCVGGKCLDLSYKGIKPNKNAIVYLLPTSVDSLIINELKRINAPIFFKLSLKAKDTFEISVIDNSKPLGSDVWAKSTNRVAYLNKGFFPIVFDYDDVFASSEPASSISKKSATSNIFEIEYSRTLYHYNYYIVFDRSGNIIDDGYDGVIRLTPKDW